MLSLMLSQLGKRFATADASVFRSAFPNHWIIWEPGAWNPPTGRTSTTLLQIGRPNHATPTPAASSGPAAEALAFGLVFKGGQPHDLTLGRADTADIAINDATLSAAHLVFAVDAMGNWMVRDAGSKNGSMLDGRPLIPGLVERLRDGANLKAGLVSLSFYSPETMFRRLKALQLTSGRTNF